MGGLGDYIYRDPLPKLNGILGIASIVCCYSFMMLYYYALLRSHLISWICFKLSSFLCISYAKLLSWFWVIKKFPQLYFGSKFWKLIICFLNWQIASHLFEYTWNLWKNDVQTILQKFQCIAINSSVDQEHDLALVCERWLLCLKIIRQLIISGYSSDTTTAQVNMHLLSLIFYSILLFPLSEMSVDILIISGGSTDQGSLSCALACHSIFSTL